MHEGAVALASPGGSLIASYGEIDRPFYLRSSAKPFQAHVAVDAGAELAPVELALAAASHDGEPLHIALVDSMLAGGALTVRDLRCPPAWPLGERGKRRVLRAGEMGPRRVWHNCSGKHGSWLRACDAAGWPIDSYLDPNHPLQRRIVEFVSDLGGYSVEAVGVDGCGAPVLRTTTRVMAVLYARLGALPEMRHVFDVMHRYPALVSGQRNPDAAIATAIHAAAKRGAEGCLGVAVKDRMGIAVKAWSGSGAAAGVAAVHALDSLGGLTSTARSHLVPIARPAVLGGGEVVGHLQPGFELDLN